MTFARITVRPDVCTGKPCIRDLRFPVSRLLGLLASGQSREDVLRAYPYLEAADIDEALRLRRKPGGRRDDRADRLKFLVDISSVRASQPASLRLGPAATVYHRCPSSSANATCT